MDNKIDRWTNVKQLILVYDSTYLKKILMFVFFHEKRANMGALRLKK